MIIEVVCKEGVIHLPKEVKLKHGSVVLKLEIPEQEIVKPGSPPGTDSEVEGSSLPQRNAASVRKRIDAILGPYKNLLTSRQPFGTEEYEQMRRDHLEEKYLAPRKASDS